MAIWALQTASNFTRFCFPIKSEETLFEELVKNSFEVFNPTLEKWPSFHMIRAEPMKHTDFFEINDTDIVAISQKAADVLCPFFDNTELLPIETDAGKYYALNVMNFVDCLDKGKSNYVATKNGKIVSYTLLEFHKERVDSASLFRLPELPYQIFISNDIEDQCEQHRLRGLLFDPKSNLVWYPS